MSITKVYSRSLGPRKLLRNWVKNKWVIVKIRGSKWSHIDFSYNTWHNLEASYFVWRCPSFLECCTENLSGSLISTMHMYICVFSAKMNVHLVCTWRLCIRQHMVLLDPISISSCICVVHWCVLFRFKSLGKLRQKIWRRTGSKLPSLKLTNGSTSSWLARWRWPSQSRPRSRAFWRASMKSSQKN